MEAPILQILVRKGPKSGESLACKPGSDFKIGRVIKGNDFAVRDPGVSQQHLRFEFLPEDSRWFITDLDSSNGTMLNGSRIEASVPVPVSDGDAIEIGGKTELALKIEKTEVLKENKRRVTGRGRSRISMAVEEAKEVEIRVLRSQRKARSNAVIVSDEEGEKNKASKSNFTSDLGTIEGTKEEKSRVLRGRRKNAMAEEVKIPQEEAKKNETLLNFDLIADLGATKMGKKRRGRAKKIDVTENSSKVSEEKDKIRESVAISCLETEEPEENKEMKLRRNPRRAKSSRVLKDLDGNSREVISKRKGRGRGKVVRVSEEQIGEITGDIVTEAQNENHGSDSVLVSDLKNETGGGEERNIEETEVDFENMTLGQWFDRMELVLTKIIHDECDAIKNILRVKAQKMDEFLEAGDNHAGL